jgi:hypothetical protein
LSLNAEAFPAAIADRGALDAFQANGFTAFVAAKIGLCLRMIYTINCFSHKLLKPGDMIKT